jgi:hypothetical protein
MWVKLAGGDLPGSITVMEDVTPPHRGPPLHAHPFEEWFYILEGSFLFELAGTPFSVAVGDFVHAPSNEPHVVRHKWDFEFRNRDVPTGSQLRISGLSPRAISVERPMAYPVLKERQPKKPPMNASLIYRLGNAPLSVSKTETLDRQSVQRIATLISLISLAAGFFVVGMLTLMNRHQADLNGFSGGGYFAVAGAAGAILVGTVFLFAACLYGRSCARGSVAFSAGRETARFAFSIPESTTAIAAF